MSNDFYALLSSKSDQELLAMVEQERASYTADAINAAELILLERSVAFTAPPEEVVVQKKEKTPTPFMPFVIGLIFVLMAFLSITTDMIRGEGAAVVVLTTNIIFRAIVVTGILDLTRKYKLSRKLWVTLGVIFGGWSLMAINVVIWVGLDDDTRDDRLREEGQRDEVVDMQSGHHGFDACPACQHMLTGDEQDCPDCGLSLIS